MNKELYDKRIKIPDEIREHMRNSFSSVSSESKDEGHKRNKELQDSNEISYQQLKRIKNFFDTYQGKPNDPSFILNGGVLMRTWVNNTLNNMRNNTTNNQQVTQTEDPTIQSKDLKTNVKNLVRPSKEHKRTSQKHATATFEHTVVESLKRINELISKI